jgi:dihydropyrimidine dehydrogenase (NAD+) subunit PreT
LVCDVMKLGAPDYSGKPAPEPTGETITLEADMVIKATGQKPFEDLVSHYGIENRKGKILSKENHATNISKIFAGGDCVNGGKEVVDAVQAGKEAAASIMSYLGVTQV